jgi:hypothetical protein
VEKIKKTIWHLLTNNKESLFFACFFIVWYFPFHSMRLLKSDGEVHEFFNGVLLVFISSLVFGGLLSKGQSKLSETYLVVYNKKYQIHIFNSLSITAIVFSMLIAFFYSDSINQFSYYFLMSAISAIFIAIKTNNAKQNSLFLIPLLLIWRSKLMINDELALAIIALDVFIMLMIIANYYRNLGSLDFRLKIYSDNISERSQENSCNLSNKISTFVMKFKSFQKGKIDYAIKSPFAITGLTGVLFFVLITALELLVKTEPLVLLVLANLAIAIMTLLMAINARKQMPETTKFAHVFTGMKHKQFKNKLLSSLDKSILFNSFTFLSLLLLVLAILPLSFDLKFLSISSFAILIFSLSFYPIIICYTGKKFVRLVPLITYALVIIYIIFQLFTRGINTIPNQAIIIFTVLCLIFRVLAQMLLWNTPYEDLVNTDEW